MSTQPDGKTVFIIHTSSVSVDYLNKLFKEFGPHLTVRNIIDDSLLPEVLTHGGVTEGVRQRIVSYARLAEQTGAAMIFNQCSSVGEAADLAAKEVKIPLIKVDEEMARVAVESGKKIGVVATLGTTLGPTCRLIQRTADVRDKPIEIVERLVEGAFEKLVGGDRAGHNAMVIASIRQLCTEVDVVVCAQGSMVALLDDLGQTPVPVLTSPRMGVEHAVKMLATR